MTHSQFAVLSNRALIRIGGPDATHFLQNLVTCDVETISEGSAGFGALLTPQGKIFFDFLIARTADGYLLDTPRETAADLAKRLTFYRLRAKVEITLLDETEGTVAVWGAPAPALQDGLTVTDPRLAALGQRVLGPITDIARALAGAGAEQSTFEAYHIQRIALGVPEGLADFAYSDIFPHDADMDQLGGVSFTKGCYVGQEVVSRMQHRSTARKRIIQVETEAALPAAGTEITADGRALGSLTSAEGRNGLAILRLDKVKSALDQDLPIFAGDVPITVRLPEWARFGWPETASND
ncbi:CAF17-like 4Fe-4S cluster assembly/insertion protein YgfZ [Roseibium suaedae]|uniref:Uncharacterized protein n=1 Tax=Roseibium suaedae TaxID=735517 RepID=A0A1M7B350_9HYPH|nr:folate-binding protein YgfZ [Roseibium suaedae]SHL49400.1 hypothetical protein SAMN05444272_0717 [Roseibium suaedae]